MAVLSRREEFCVQFCAGTAKGKDGLGTFLARSNCDTSTPRNAPLAGDGVTSSKGATAKSGLELRLSCDPIVFFTSRTLCFDFCACWAGGGVTADTGGVDDKIAGIDISGAAGSAAAAALDTTLPAAALTVPKSPVAAAAAPPKKEFTEVALAGVVPSGPFGASAEAIAPSLSPPGVQTAACRSSQGRGRRELTRARSAPCKLCTTWERDHGAGNSFFETSSRFGARAFALRAHEMAFTRIAAAHLGREESRIGTCSSVESAPLAHQNSDASLCLTSVELCFCTYKASASGTASATHAHGKKKAPRRCATRSQREREDESHLIGLEHHAGGTEVGAHVLLPGRIAGVERRHHCRAILRHADPVAGIEGHQCLPPTPVTVCKFDPKGWQNKNFFPSPKEIPLSLRPYGGEHWLPDVGAEGSGGS